MKFSVTLTLAARRDIADIAAYIAERDSLAKADTLLDGLAAIIDDLETLPERGRHIPELPGPGWSHFRERFFKPYRIIYRIDGKEVRIMLVADGRRDMQTLLLRRLAGS